jgi:apolipoprotein N-acyltransferase
LVLALRGVGPIRAAALGFVWGFAATALVTVWLVPTLDAHFGMSRAGSIGFWLALAAGAAAPYLALACAGFALASRLAPPALVPCGFAAAWVAAEYARAQLGLRSPWASLGYTQIGSELVLQLAAFGGHYAVGAFVAFVNAVAAEGLRVLRFAPAPRRSRAIAGLVGTLLVVAAGSWAWGARRLAATQGEAPGSTIALVQGAVAPEELWRRESAPRVLHRHLSLTAEALAGTTAPDLVVWPETAVPTPLDDPVFGPALRAASGGRVSVLLGAPRREARDGTLHHFNSAWLVRPDGGVEHYDKRRLLPFSESRPLDGLAALGTTGDLDPGPYTAGEAPGLFTVGSLRIGVLICMEALYPELAREAVEAGARVLVNLSNDAWYRGRGGAEQHFAPVVFRAIETGVPVVRAAATGITAVVGPSGRVLARLPANEPGVLLGPTPPAHATPPPYLALGDAFARGCVAVWAIAAIAAGLRQRADTARKRIGVRPTDGPPHPVGRTTPVRPRA